MAVDFAHPVIDDLYSGANGWPTYLQDNIAAVAGWLEGIDPPGKRVGFKRYNAGALQKWDGSAWVALPLNYLAFTGGTLTGALTIKTDLRPQLQVWSGVANLNAYAEFGRTARDGLIGVSGLAGGLVTGDSPGDIGIRAENGVIRFSNGPISMVTIHKDSGFISGLGGQFIGITQPAAATGVGIGTAGGSPHIRWTNLGAPVDQKNFDVYQSTGGLIFRAVNDAYNLANVWLEVARSGFAVPAINFPSGKITMSGYDANYATLVLAGGVVASHGICGVSNSADWFTYDGFPMWNYGIKWYQASNNANGPSAVIAAYGDIRLVSQQNTSLIVRGGRTGISRFPGVKNLDVDGGIALGFSDSECLRMYGEGSYFAWYSSDASRRKGYLQMTGSDYLWSNEDNAMWRFVGGGVNRLVISNNGHVYAGDTVDANRLVRASEVGANSNYAILPGGVKFIYGKVTTTVGGGSTGTLTFPLAFTSVVYASVAYAQTSPGIGWIFRYFNQTLSKFEYAWDNYNTAGSGSTGIIHYVAIGI